MPANAKGTLLTSLSAGTWQIVEQKGLDIVRRDWCPLSKDCGNFALRHILSGEPRDEVVAAIHEHLEQVRPHTVKLWCFAFR